MTHRPSYIIPPGPGGHLMQVQWTEHGAECLETALDATTEAIRHATAVCAHVRDLITNAAPSPVPMAAASILHMTFLALDTLSQRECEELAEAETRIKDWRRKAVEDRKWREEEAARERAAAKAGMKDFATTWAAQGNRNPDEKESAE